MIIHHFESENSLLNTFLAEIRDLATQKDPMRFRRNIERIGEILGYEMSKTLNYQSSSVTTPFGNKEMHLPTNNLVLCSVLRAGLPLHHGLLSYFDRAGNAFISAYRDHPDGRDDFEVVVKYLAAPSLEGKTLVLTDPMLATGKTLENVFEALKTHGKPQQIHIISVIGSRDGVAYVQKIFPENTHLWIASIDNEITARGYILPGLGDAGDLAFGLKL
jgi:uracil phosphoribosyltransferase